jgi:hypothetical protein
MVLWKEVVQFERLDARVLGAEWLCGDVIGVGDGFVEWCPNHDPPSAKEAWAWWWVVRPDLGAANEIRAVMAD